VQERVLDPAKQPTPLAVIVIVVMPVTMAMTMAMLVVVAIDVVVLVAVVGVPWFPNRDSVVLMGGDTMPVTWLYRRLSHVPSLTE